MGEFYQSHGGTHGKSDRLPRLTARNKPLTQLYSELKQEEKARPMPAIIEVDHLTFHYPGVRALDDISFRIEPGTVTALVGPNGAGKTTLLGCLAALERPLAGQITLDGISVIDQPRQSHKLIGYLPDFYGLYEDLSVEQCLRYMAMAQGIPENKLSGAVTVAAERVQLADRLKIKTGTLSRGLKQRLAIGQAIIHEPRILLLDEPASGLDPEARQHLSDLLIGLRQRGITIVVSSHILTELNDYSTHMMVIRDGQLVEHRRIDGQADERQRTLILILARPAADLAAKLQAHPGVGTVRLLEQGAEFEFGGDPSDQYALLKHLIETGLPVCALNRKEQNLQKAYLGRP